MTKIRNLKKIEKNLKKIPRKFEEKRCNKRSHNHGDPMAADLMK